MENLKIEFIRDNEQMATSVVPKYDEQAKRALIGVTAPVDVKSVGFGESIALAFATVVNIIYQMYSGLIGMITGSVSAELSGPVGVAQMTSQAAHFRFSSIITICCIIEFELRSNKFIANSCFRWRTFCSFISRSNSW